MQGELREVLEEFLSHGEYLVEEPLKNHCHFKIGGTTPYLIQLDSVDRIKSVIELFRMYQQPYFVMGNGTNLLVSDEGVSFPIIKLGNHFSKVRVEDAKIIAQSGALLSSVSKIAKRESLSGLEFASGIPGSIGGAVAMNAGAYGGEIKDVFLEALCLTKDGKTCKLGKEEMEFGYRTSRVLREKMTVLEVKFRLSLGKEEEIASKMKELDEKRITKQPVQFPSAGSTFKRPEGFFAGKLVEDCGLKGLRYGDAQVSDLHCGFIINVGNATAKDVKTLIGVIQKTVQDQYDVKLETEVQMLGF